LNALSSLTNLQILNLHGNHLIDLSALSSLTNLKELDLRAVTALKPHPENKQTFEPLTDVQMRELEGSLINTKILR